MPIPEFTISQEKLESIREQILEDGNFQIEVIENDWSLDIFGTGRVKHFHEKETNCSWSEYGHIEITIRVYDEDGNKADFSDEFEKNIFDQINTISK